MSGSAGSAVPRAAGPVPLRSLRLTALMVSATEQQAAAHNHLLT
jgi:hypothetical protein